MGAGQSADAAGGAFNCSVGGEMYEGIAYVVSLIAQGGGLELEEDYK